MTQKNQPVLLSSILGNDESDSGCKYIKIRKLGAGSYGECWLVHRTSDQAKLVAKIIDLSALPGHVQTSMEQEVECLASCDHFAVIKFYEDYVQEAEEGTEEVVVDAYGYGDGGFRASVTGTDLPLPEAHLNRRRSSQSPSSLPPSGLLPIISPSPQKGRGSPPSPASPHTHAVKEAVKPMLLIIMEYANSGDLGQVIKARASTPAKSETATTTTVGSAPIIPPNGSGGTTSVLHHSHQQPFQPLHFEDHQIGFTFIQLAMALDHVHKRGMLHRDIKGGNVLLSKNGLVKLADFGFSQKYQPPAEVLEPPTAAGESRRDSRRGSGVLPPATSSTTGEKFTVCGTPYFFAPEIWQRQAFTPKADVWALGVLLFEMLALKKPFSSNPTGPMPNAPGDFLTSGDDSHGGDSRRGSLPRRGSISSSRRSSTTLAGVVDMSPQGQAHARLNRKLNNGGLRALMDSVLSGVIPPLPAKYDATPAGRRLKSLIFEMLVLDPLRRPSMGDLFAMNSVQGLVTDFEDAVKKSKTITSEDKMSVFLSIREVRQDYFYKTTTMRGSDLNVPYPGSGPSSSASSPERFRKSISTASSFCGSAILSNGSQQGSKNQMEEAQLQLQRDHQRAPPCSFAEGCPTAPPTGVQRKSILEMQREHCQQQQQQEQEQEQLAGRHVHLLVRHLMPQLGALFSPPVSPVPVPVEAPPPPPAPLTTTATTRGGTARAAGLDELQQMQTSKALYTASDFVGAIEGFKRTVSLVRKRQRKQRGSEAQVQNGEGAALVAEAYLLMGRCFMAQNKPPRAEACFVLASKSAYNSTDESAVRAREELLQLRLTSEAASFHSGGVDENARVVALRDVEDLLANHSLHPPQHTSNSEEPPFKFACTMCGECCRSADNLLLTPHDVYTLTRSPGLAVQGILSTEQLLSHPRFKGVFHYTQRGGVAPLCSLRPVQQRDVTGHCFFAYPLYSRPSRPIDRDMLATGKKTALYQVSIEEVDEIVVGEGTLKTQELVPYSDYFLASQYTRSSNNGDERSLDDNGLDDELHEELQLSGVELEGDNSHQLEFDQIPESWQAVSNSFGRQALGCMLGVEHMPAMCRTYPVAPELSQADFWHVREAFWRKGYMDSDHDLGQRNRQEHKLHKTHTHAPGWQVEEHYMSVKTEGCEGFESTIAELEKTPIRNGKYVNSVEKIYSGDESNIGVTSDLSMKEFLGSSTLDRLEESQWFMALVSDVSAHFRTDDASGGDIFSRHPLGRGLRLLYMNRLAQLWFNFDSMQCFRKRPIKSYRRLKADIETLTWILVTETVKFVEDLFCERIGGDSDSIGTQYDALLTRLNII